MAPADRRLPFIPLRLKHQLLLRAHFSFLRSPGPVFPFSLRTVTLHSLSSLHRHPFSHVHDTRVPPAISTLSALAASARRFRRSVAPAFLSYVIPPSPFSLLPDRWPSSHACRLSFPALAWVAAPGPRVQLYRVGCGCSIGLRRGIRSSGLLRVLHLGIWSSLEGSDSKSNS